MNIENAMLLCYYYFIMKQTFDNSLNFKMALNNLVHSLNTNNPNSVYNIFCHHIDENKVENMEDIMEDIMQNGLKCNYSTISRTLTYMGSSDSFAVDSLYSYAYVSSNYKIRNVILVAIPKYIKKNNGEIIDFSTPEGNQNGWKKRCYSVFDQLKGIKPRILPLYNLCSYSIDEINKTYTLNTNEQHLGKLKNSKKQVVLNEIRHEIDGLQK